MTNKIEFTKEATDQIEKIVLKQGSDIYFRISVQGGGCSGFKYNFTFDSKIEKDDRILLMTIFLNIHSLNPRF